MPESFPPHLPAARRIVAGHDEAGRAAFIHDDAQPLTESAFGPHLLSGPMWVTTETPSRDNTSNEDARLREPTGGFGLVQPGGTNFRATDLAPGETTPMHRTSSIDYNILIFGELTSIMEDGTEKRLSTPGDVVVTKGNMHAWKNTGKEWCRWITVLVDAEPAVVDGQKLEEVMGS